MPLRAVHLRERGSRWTTRRTSRRRRVRCARSAKADPDAPGVARGHFRSGLLPREWDFQLSASLRISGRSSWNERSRVQLARAGLAALNRLRRDAVPLVGFHAGDAASCGRRSSCGRYRFHRPPRRRSGVGKELVARQIHEWSGGAGAVRGHQLRGARRDADEAELFGIEDERQPRSRRRASSRPPTVGRCSWTRCPTSRFRRSQAAARDPRLAVERVGGNGTHRAHPGHRRHDRSLRDLVEHRLFRPDLFYRSVGSTCACDAPRAPADVIELAQYFLDSHHATCPLRLTPAAIDALMTHDCLERPRARAADGARRHARDLRRHRARRPPATVRGDYAVSLGPSLRRNDTLRAWASRYARLVLDRCGGNKREACDSLDISYHTLNRICASRSTTQPRSRSGKRCGPRRRSGGGANRVTGISKGCHQRAALRES